MKHHWADLLDRESGYFSITENAHRNRYAAPDLALVRDEQPILTVGSATQNWQRMREFPALEELTLHEPLPEQIAALAGMSGLKRLRITHARRATLEPLRGLVALEELVLEYVSKVADLSPLGALPHLRALHIENLRGMHDFSGLDGAALRTLTITGTCDLAQSIDSLDFVAGLAVLERLTLLNVRLGAAFPVFRGLARSPVGYVKVRDNLASLEDFAWLAAHRPDLAASLPPAVEVWWGDRSAHGKMLAHMMEQNGGVLSEELEKRLWILEPDEATCTSVIFLGKGERSVNYRYRSPPHRGGPDAATLARIARHEGRYRALVARFEDESSVTDF